MERSRDRPGRYKSVSRYILGHYRTVYLSKDVHAKVVDLANKLNKNIKDLVEQLILRYGDKLVEDVLAEKSSVSSVNVQSTSKSKVELKRKSKKIIEGYIIDLGEFGTFTVTSNEWSLFTHIIENTSKREIEAIINMFPSEKLRDLFIKMYLALAVKYDKNKWIIDYNVFKLKKI